MTVLPLPTPAELEADASWLEREADHKTRLSSEPWVTNPSAYLEDAAIFRSEAASKRAKAERMRKAVTP